MVSSETRAAKPFSLRAALRARHAALPAEHGAWVFLLSPLTIGLAVGGLRPGSLALILAVLAAFLARQPLTLAVKALSGRRPRGELPTAAFWLAVYGAAALLAAGALAALGHAYLLWLALPAAPVFAWHLWLVSRRAERRQMLVEIIASGVLALAAPAALWVGRGYPDPAGWLLWGLCWLQVAGTILHAYLRLAQRALKCAPTPAESLRMGRAALFYNLAVLLVVVGLAAARIAAPTLPLAFAIQPLETAWAIYRPAVGVKPTAIGVRQLIVSVIFTAAFLLTW